MLLYFNYVLFQPYLTPIFWAGVCAIVLRSARDAMVRLLRPLSRFEADAMPPKRHKAVRRRSSIRRLVT